jgi:hypothetical protein
MGNAKRLAVLEARKYQELFGIKQETFDKMLSVLAEADNKHQAHKEAHRVGGRPARLRVLDKLIIMLGY